MLKLTHKQLIVISGLVWLIIGGFLLQLGLKLLVPNSKMERIEITALLIVVALVIGYFKGKYVLGKSVKRGVERILSFSNPTSIWNLYSWQYYLLIGVMIGLGMMMKILNVPPTARGVVDVAVGAALINGAVIYFQHANRLKAASPKL